MARPKSAIKKKHLTAFISEELADGFREATEPYSGKLGLCLCAAMVMFMEADPEVQATQVQRVFTAELKGEMAALVVQAQSARGKSGRRVK